MEPYFVLSRKKKHGVEVGQTGGVLFYVKQHPGIKPDKLAPDAS
jgi:hypothetical protein